MQIYLSIIGYKTIVQFSKFVEFMTLEHQELLENGESSSNTILRKKDIC
jgi:hypothetical protein